MVYGICGQPLLFQSGEAIKIRPAQLIGSGVLRVGKFFGGVARFGRGGNRFPEWIACLRIRRICGCAVWVNGREKGKRRRILAFDRRMDGHR